MSYPTTGNPLAKSGGGGAYTTTFRVGGGASEEPPQHAPFAFAPTCTRKVGL